MAEYVQKNDGQLTAAKIIDALRKHAGPLAHLTDAQAYQVLNELVVRKFLVEEYRITSAYQGKRTCHLYLKHARTPTTSFKMIVAKQKKQQKR